MSKTGPTDTLRLAVPQVITALRIILGMYAIWVAAQHQFDLAAKILVLGIFTDVLDGALARKLGVTSQFGLLFDFFADYLYYVVAPTNIVLFLLAPTVGWASLFLLILPALFGALRYARKATLDEGAHPGIRGAPGLPTNVYAFYVLSWVFLWRERVLDADMLSRVLTVTVPFLALLMPATRRYPWLTDYLWIFAPMMVGLYAMPFLLTGILASVTIVLIAAYVLFSPLLIRHQTEHPARPMPEDHAVAH